LRIAECGLQNAVLILPWLEGNPRSLMIANCVVGASQDGLRKLLILASVGATECTTPNPLSASVDEADAF